MPDRLKRRVPAAFLVLVSAVVPPALSATEFRQSQNPSSKLPKGKAQKVQNPLNDLLDEAQADLDKNNFEAAIPPLQKFLAEKPEVAFAHFQLAYAYTGLNRTEEARAEYERCIALEPKMAEAQLNLGILLLEKDPSAAVTPLRRAIELLPSQSRPRFLLGVAQERSGDLAGAAESFESASHLNTGDAEALTHLGEVYLQLKKPAEAEKKFRMVLELQAKFTPALRGLALSLDAQDKPEAIAAYRNYLAAAPQDATARARLVQLLVANKQFEEASAEAEKSPGGQVQALDALRLRADILIGQNKFEDAIATLKQAIALAPRDAQLHGGLGRLYLEKHDFAGAESELKIAVQLDKSNLVYWKDLTATFYKSGNYAAALAGYDVVEKMEKPNAGVWFIRALCYDKLNQVQPALDAYRKFLDLDQNQHPDQVWQANQRIHVLEKRAEKKK
ncbi:MAG TPA: tetratricopeptide repeat protein [Candidatus Sulfotelmatobacter sp.]|jgi:Flp pilus assembly protein TadD|nr:tetratricopeptide repeat protein [Candidatus Sulfotelmatobacter sp.]